MFLLLFYFYILHDTLVLFVVLRNFIYKSKNGRGVCTVSWITFFVIGFLFSLLIECMGVLCRQYTCYYDSWSNVFKP